MSASTGQAQAAAAAAPELPLLNIFISHKTKDEAAAGTLKDLLDASCKNVKVFLSRDSKSLRRGVPWREAIHDALDQANWLILIYTTPGDNWDWCIYEAGYFAGRTGGKRTENLLVLHPPGVQPPPPLQAWQSIPAESRRLFDYFEAIFEIGSPDCQFKGDVDAMRKLADDICNAIAPLREKSFRPNKSLTLFVPPSDETGELTDLPSGTKVDLHDQGTADLMGLQYDAAYPWRRFKDEVGRCGFDTERLVETVSLARSLRAVPDSLRLFRSPKENRGYRPLIYDVTRQDSGAVEVQLMLAPLPPTVSPERLNKFERIIALLELAKRFRREVAEAFAAQIPEIDRSPNDALRLQFLRAIRLSIEQIRTDAHHQGFGNPETLPEAFEPSQEPHVKELQSKWEACFKALNNAIDTSQPGVRPGDILNPMRAINLSFMRLALQRLQQIATQFRVPDLLKVGSPYRDWIPADMLTEHEEMMPFASDQPLPAAKTKPAGGGGGGGTAKQRGQPVPKAKAEAGPNPSTGKRQKAAATAKGSKSAPQQGARRSGDDRHGRRSPR